MITKGLKRRRVFVVSAILIAASIVSVAVFSAKKQEPKQQQTKDWLASLPAVSSKIKDLEIINPRIVRQGTEIPGVAFEIRNNSKRGVMAIEIACGEGSIAKDGLEDEEKPVVIIEPFGTLTAEMSGELSSGNPIVITAAIFDDQKEEGLKSSLELMHKVTTRERARRAAEKAQAARGRRPNQ